MGGQRQPGIGQIRCHGFSSDIEQPPPIGFADGAKDLRDIQQAVFRAGRVAQQGKSILEESLQNLKPGPGVMAVFPVQGWRHQCVYGPGGRLRQVVRMGL